MAEQHDAGLVTPMGGLKTLTGVKPVDVNGRRFFVSKIPAFEAMMIWFKITQAFGMGGIQAMPREAMLELLSYGGIFAQDGREVQFANEDIINLHCKDMRDSLLLTKEVIKENYSFFDGGGALNITADIVEMITANSSSTKTSTPSSGN